MARLGASSSSEEPLPRLAMNLRALSPSMRYAMRSLRKHPLFTVIAVLSLGLALALNTTMFALVDAVVHPYVPYPEPERIVTANFFSGDRDHFVPLAERYRAIRDGSTAYDAIAGYSFLWTLVHTRTAAENQLVTAVTPEFFDVLGVRPMVGRPFSPAGPAARNDEVLISFRLWNRLFAGRPLESGLTLGVGTLGYTVVGVMPRGVHFPYDADIWVPLASLPTDTTTRRNGPIAAALRLKQGVTPEMARAELEVVARRLTLEFAQRRSLYAVVNSFARHVQTGSPVPSFLPITVALVLIIACANLGTMMLARGMARRRETAIRMALGASRRVVAGLVLIECGLVVSAGVAIGIVLTFWALHILPHVATPWVPVLGDIQPVPSWRVFSLVLAASVAMLLLAGVAPALRAAGTDPAEPMKESAGTTTGRIRDRYNPLIIVEVALSTALLMSAALFIIYVARMAIFDFRYAAKRLVVAGINANGKTAATDTDVERFYTDLLARSRQLPGARAAATMRSERPDGPTVLGEQGKSGERWMNLINYSVVSPDFLRTFGITVTKGRDFAPGDANAATGVVIVDEKAAARLWPDLRTPVGRMIKFGRAESKRPWLRVIGVAHAVDLLPRRDTDLPPEPSIYVVYGHDVARQRDLLVQSDGVGGDRGRADLAVAVRREIQAVAPTMGLPKVRAWLDSYENVRSASAFMASLFAALGTFGLALCALGLYGVLAYAVSRRLRELAVRIALGARRRDVARLVLHDAAVTALAGVGVGAFVALWVTRAISELLSNVGYADVAALLVAEGILFAVAVAACAGPVRQAIRADPGQILRAS